MTYGYDELNRLSTVTDASGVTNYSYDEVGNLASFTYGDSLMLREDWLQTLEKAIMARNPSLVTKLRPRLSEAQVKRALSRSKVMGEAGPIVALYTWKDGMDLTSDPAMPNFNEWKANRSFFPGKPYFFIPLELAIAGFDSLREIAKSYPNIAEAIGRYFPLFSDGSTEHLAIDVKPSSQNRVLIVDHRSEQPIREAYSSFEEFVADAIRANKANAPLRCFQTLQTK